MSKRAVKIVPLLKEKPRLFTKYTSILPNNASVRGSNNLKIKSKTATDSTLAMINPLKVTVL